MLATTTSAGRGWVWRSSATARARAAPVRPATRRQTSPWAKDFASATKAGHSCSISERFTVPRRSSLAGRDGTLGAVGVETTTRHASAAPLAWAPSRRDAAVVPYRERVPSTSTAPRAPPRRPDTAARLQIVESARAEPVFSRFCGLERAHGGLGVGAAAGWLRGRRDPY